ncbi:hypothetical protein SAMN05216587_102294 [Selenomonas ruminantium]|uniref:Uncharacterized protein n=1 Tax=Selenomonas ruminantium TaxID=971 RepID=A0A1I0WAC4_SELRU|nr:hypothetical protein SAMN05216587_102294 [Selenomonas ruminantium]
MGVYPIGFVTIETESIALVIYNGDNGLYGLVLHKEKV